MPMPPTFEVSVTPSTLKPHFVARVAHRWSLDTPYDSVRDMTLANEEIATQVANNICEVIMEAHTQGRKDEASRTRKWWQVWK